MLRQIIVAFWALCAWPVLGQTQVFLVGNEGVDAPECGWTGHRCRSISQAIRNAADGDAVFVEAGVYGDLNRNGIIGEPGEETGGEIAGGSSCECLVHIDKRVTILSERGASATIIDTASTGLVGVTVDGEGAAFGYTGMGFTVLAPSKGSVEIPGTGIGPSVGIRLGVPSTIAGNRIVGLVHDLDFEDRHSLGVESVAGGDIYDNEVSGFQYGIKAVASRIAGNVMTRNDYGLWIANSPLAPPAVVEDNVIADNRVGIEIRVGVGLLGITGNDVLYNKYVGIQQLAGTSNAHLNPSVVLQDNNIIGNGYDNVHGNCGLTNDSHGGFIWAAYNYWGALGTSDRACEESGQIQIDPVRLQPDSRVSN
jgi:hypothetical protein